jgi:hypothetical protein
MGEKFMPQVVSSGDGLRQYPISREDRLDAHSFIKWWHHRWKSSRTFKLASWEAQGMARALFDMAWDESPVGTLPDDDAELAVMLRTNELRVAELRRMDFGPFRGWRRCLSGDEIRLMHPVVLEQVSDALMRRDMREASEEDAAARKRLERLRKALGERGFGYAELSDAILLQRMEDWLTQHWKRNRTKDAYDQVVATARKLGWVSLRLT